MKNYDEQYEAKLVEETCRLLTELLKDEFSIRFLSKAERTVLCDEGDSCVTSASGFKCDIVGYPVSPLVRHLANFLVLVMCTGHCPIEQQPKFELFDESKYPEQRRVLIGCIRRRLQGALTLWDFWNDEEKKKMFADVFRCIGRRGFLDLLQIRRTVGSANVLLIPRHRLVEKLTQLKDPSGQLTVCGRAMTKHAGRDSTRWWGALCGNDQQKNERGMEVANRIFDNACWINLHGLPGSIITLEIRTVEGYGLRFDYDPLRFRGFLEPFQLEGWLNEYRH